MGRIEYEGYEPKHLSFSTVNGFRSCGKRFELTKVFQLEEHPGLAAIGGNAVHAATELIDRADFFGTVLDIRNGEGEGSGDSSGAPSASSFVPSA